MGRHQGGRLHAAARAGNAGRPARRHLGLLPHYGDSPGAGAILHRADWQRHQPVAIIDEKFAQRFWPRGDPIGKHVWNDPKAQAHHRRRSRHGQAVRPRYRRPHRGVLPASRFGRHTWWRARRGDPGVVAAHGPRDPRDGPTVPVYDMRTMQGRLYDSLARQRFSTTMLGAFAAFALILAAVGIYGVMSYLVNQGAHDIGVRIALGAQRARILRMVVRQGMRPGGVGIVAGLIGAAALTRLMASLLFGVSATDALTFAAVPYSSPVWPCSRATSRRSARHGSTRNRAPRRVGIRSAGRVARARAPPSYRGSDGAANNREPAERIPTRRGARRRDRREWREARVCSSRSWQSG